MIEFILVILVLLVLLCVILDKAPFRDWEHYSDGANVVLFITTIAIVGTMLFTIVRYIL